MASIKNSLRKIYTALGGSNSKSKTITGLLDDISTVASSGSGGGGNNDFKVTMTYNESDESYTLDKSYNNIVNALNSGKPVYTIYTSGQTNYVMYVESTQISNGKYVVNFMELMSNISYMDFSSNSPDGLLIFWFE